ncbi:MAG: hypothetical protein H6849_02575 [Alphaproteobacteria bacterium]|nr:MAG: hypothetical protein H6849_02575 [Alphaproteobacteria bacterium]
MYAKLLTSWPIFLPPFLTIALAMISKRPGFSIICGIFLGVFIKVGVLDHQYVFEFVKYFREIFYKDNTLVANNISLFIFLWLLGSYTSLLDKSGALGTMTGRLMKFINTPRKCEMAIIVIALIVFIDDYFNSLIVGAIALPMVQKLGVSREKLAYYLDSTAGPACILIPFSSWGVTIMAIIERNLQKHNLIGLFSFEVFIKSAAYNFYAIGALVLTLVVAFTTFDFPLMRALDKKSQDSLKTKSPEDPLHVDQSHQLRVKRNVPEERNLFFAATTSLSFLLVGTIIIMLLSGYILSNYQTNLMKLLNHIDVGISLILGAVGSLALVSVYLNPSVPVIKNSFVEGYKSMAPAMKILMLAWALSSVIQDLNIGHVLSDFLIESGLNPAFIPLSVFIVAGILSFSSGTSWATFSILVPIVFDLVMATNQNLLYISLGATLGGAVMGDHSSPISDTSILSSTGAKCDHMSHVVTQLPYCVLVGVLSGGGYLMFSYFY